MRNESNGRRRVTGWVCSLLVLLSSVALSGQEADGGNAGAAIGGAALGAYGGGFTGALAGELVCGEDLLESSCSTVAPIGGAALGAGAGVWLGASDSERIGGAARGAAIGAALGALIWAGLETSGLRQADYGPAWVEGALFAGAVGTLAGALASGGDEAAEAGAPVRAVVVTVPPPW